MVNFLQKPFFSEAINNAVGSDFIEAVRQMIDKIVYGHGRIWVFEDNTKYFNALLCGTQSGFFENCFYVDGFFFQLRSFLMFSLRILRLNCQDFSHETLYT